MSGRALLDKIDRLYRLRYYTICNACKKKKTKLKKNRKRIKLHREWVRQTREKGEKYVLERRNLPAPIV